MERFALRVDEESCWGCKACEVACKQENRSPEGVYLIHISEDGPRMMNDRLGFVYRVNMCRHCDEPDCVEACTQEAITKRENGIVVLNDEDCIGCGLCVDECPYHAITFDNDRKKARKCNLCHHRVERGLVPACADNVCLAHCIYFRPSNEDTPH